MPQAESPTGALEGSAESAGEAIREGVQSLPSLASPMLQALEQSYKTGLRLMEQNVERALTAQSEWLQACRRFTDDVPEALTPWAQLSGGVLEAAEKGLEARVDMWQRWFDAARAIDVGRYGRAWAASSADDDNMMAAWDRLSRQAVTSQTAWLRSLVPQARSNALREPGAGVEVKPAVAAKRVRTRPVADSKGS